ncbi:MULTISPECIES: polyprenyl synthetase family protein [unclassified Francisella]|uniref:polyprenyl synthetase family protein n=1 Tax=unclassified Francisella TaxID=2610885 RepID=UPI002E3518BD|nr:MULTISPECIES: farnesyl diphosphate synthase [unclassified Francisella]MED7819426.1 polyprenyl synthetase family protein [Francisella sp. 19S2-4]MED7830215.1 polyprenyl synthetase family protein [Francisella sp. 19S2-10]
MKTEDILIDFNSFAENIFNNTSCPSDTLLEAMKYSFFSGGKRIRAQFVYSIGKIFNLNIKNCHIIAFAVEAIHTYSLIHDDLPAMDNDNLRRGKPTCHIKFNEATAILAGDALQALAFEVMQDIQIPNIEQLKKINTVFCQCCGLAGMVAGQQLDIEGENKKLELNKLETIHINKTAKMFIASILLPYLTSDDYCTSIENSLIKLSTLIGLCFQIKDDILDVTKTSTELGKTSAKDIAANKSTYVSLMGLDKANRYLNEKKNQIDSILLEFKGEKESLVNFEKLINLVINRNY